MDGVRSNGLEAYSERVQAIVELTRGPRVLHLGACGTLKADERTHRHFTHAALVDAGYSVLGTDVNQAGLRWMRELGYDVAYLDAEEIPSEGERFDTIAAGELIEHLSNPGKFLRGCASRLKPDGILVLSTPQPFTPAHLLVYLMRYRNGFNLEHTCWFDEQTLTQLLRRSGFQIAELRYVDDLYVEEAGRLFRGFATLWRLGRRLFPERLRTTLVVSARGTPQAGPALQPYAPVWETDQ
jgi:SAM-dependent methyltransferase